MKKVNLEDGIKRGDKEIKEISLRRPTAGELRGLKILDLINLDTNSLMNFIPRVTVPSINSQELNLMSPSDFVTLASESVAFLAPREPVNTDFPTE